MALVTSQSTEKDTNVVDLYIRIVSQKLEKSLRKIPILKGLLTNEDYINGIKQYIFKELPVSSVYDPAADLKMEDWNIALTKMRESVKQVTVLKIVKDKLVPSELLRAFSNDKIKAEYVNRKSQDLFTTMYLEIFNLTYATILQGKDKMMTYTVDKLVDTKNIKVIDPNDSSKQIDENETQRIERVLININKEILAMAIPSKQRVKVVKDNNWNIPHSASPENLILLANSSFYTNINAVLASKYHFEKLLPSTNLVEIDFTSFFASSAEADKIDCFLIDKSAFILGDWIQKMSADVNLPHFQKLFQLAYSINVSRIEIYPIIKFAKSV